MRSRREELGLSVRSAADQAGINRTTWTTAEAAERQLSQHLWPKVERVLGWNQGSVAAILEGGEPTVRERPSVPASALADEVARIRALPDDVASPSDKLRMVSDLLSMFEAQHEQERSAQR